MSSTTMRPPNLRMAAETSPRDLPALLDCPALAECMSISPRTLERMRLTGSGPPFLKIGARVLYDPQMVARWLQGRVADSTAAIPRAGRGRGKF